MTTTERINHVLANFDFDQVVRAMAALEWTWWDTAPKTPNREQLTECARKLLEDVVGTEGDRVGFQTGGFSASREGQTLSLRFIVEESTTEELE